MTLNGSARVRLAKDESRSPRGESQYDVGEIGHAWLWEPSVGNLDLTRAKIRCLFLDGAKRNSGTLTRLFRIFAALIAVLLMSGGTALAQAGYPAHMITLIVPFAAGGPTDVVARLLQDSMSRTLGQQIVIENVIGAGGTIAATRTMRAAPDGYTIMLGNMGTHAAAVALYPKLAYNPSTDFAPIGLVLRIPMLIVAKQAIPADNLKEFIAYAAGHSTELTMAHAGMGSVSYVTCELFNSILGLSPKLAAYQGSGPAMTALVAGKVDYMCDEVVAVVPQANAHSIKVYAVSAPARNRSLPDVPTAAEAGLPNFDVSAWNALFAPKATPGPIVATLNAAMITALEDETVRKALLDLGGDIPDRAECSPEVLAALVKSEIAKWTPILSATAGQN
jgi:tripartite-type tricarboxylate transporter receptor subunit TctC